MSEKFSGQETGAAIEVKEGVIQVDLWPFTLALPRDPHAGSGTYSGWTDIPPTAKIPSSGVNLFRHKVQRLLLFVGITIC